MSIFLGMLLPPVGSPSLTSGLCTHCILPGCRAELEPGSIYHHVFRVWCLSNNYLTPTRSLGPSTAPKPIREPDDRLLMAITSCGDRTSQQPPWTLRHSTSSFSYRLKTTHEVKASPIELASIQTNNCSSRLTGV